MSGITAQRLLTTDTVAIADVACSGDCKHKSPEECARATHLVFPYRGVYVRHVGGDEAVAEANQVLMFNQEEGYRVSHPVAGGDACLSVTLDEALLHELSPQDRIQRGPRLRFLQQRLRIDPRTQALVALLRHSLLPNHKNGRAAEPLEAEVLTFTLARRALGERTAHRAGATAGRQKLADRAKLVLSGDLARRWTLTEIAREVGVSPVYLTQVFQQVEGMPLYRYQLRLRLARALDLIGKAEDLTALGLELGFSSHSHFTAAFRQAYGRTPAEFRRSAGPR